MSQPTAYQYVKLGSNLEFLRSVSTASVMQTKSLAEFPNLMNNLAPRRYAVVEVVKVVKSLLVQLEDLGLAGSLSVAAPLRPMLGSMEDYVSRQPYPRAAYLTDSFADRLVALAVQIGTAVRTELGIASSLSPLPPVERLGWNSIPGAGQRAGRLELGRLDSDLLSVLLLAPFLPFFPHYPGQRPIGQSSCGSQAFLSMKQRQSAHCEPRRCSQVRHWLVRASCSGASTVLKPDAANLTIAEVKAAAALAAPCGARSPPTAFSVCVTFVD